MPYTDPDAVRLALTPGGDQTDKGSAAGLADPDLQSAIQDATDEVNAKLSGRYTVPFGDPVPDLVATITVSIAGYLATLTYRRGDPLDPAHPVALRYQRAEQMLTQLQNGSATLSGVSTPPSSSVSEAVVVNELDFDYFTPGDFPIRPAEPFGWPGGSLTRP